MDSAKEVEENETVMETRKTRSGRAISNAEPEKPKQQRKTRKKVVMIEVEVSEDEEPEKEEAPPSKENNDTILPTIETSDNAVEATDIREELESAGAEMASIKTENKEQFEEENKPQFDDSNSVTNDFNSFKGAEEEESIPDGINNESSSCFDVQETTENGQDVPLASDIEDVKPIVADESNVETKEIKKEEEEVDETKDEPMETQDEVKTEVADLENKVDPDAENISEDELPTVQAVKVPETEEVSDEELPGPKRAELPADTEVVSEDELETVKKENNNKRKLAEEDGGYDPGSPTSEGETAPKKHRTSDEGTGEGKSSTSSAEKKPKKLPELDKYWKAVNDDPTDFTGWTYLLQYVDQENDMEAAREAYDAFLSHYPYCYGYWRKYADYEKRKGNKKRCEEVFERGLKAIPLSVDLWIHYLTYVRTTRPDDEEFVRSQFERSLNACGLEFRSDLLWENYIKWETENSRLRQATTVFERLLSTPTQRYLQHFDNFQEHVLSNPPNQILELDEFLALRKEVKALLKPDAAEVADNPDIPPGEDTAENTDEETKAIRERIISIRRKIHKNTAHATTARWNYEEGIKRPYFHVKPLERCQLKNWHEYLDYEMGQGDRGRTIVLFERCLIACALYEEFWLKYVHYLQDLKDEDLIPKIRDVYERACTVHHLKKPNVHLQWAVFEESVRNFNKAAEILQNLDKTVPNLLQVAYRRINLERRRGDHEKCRSLYENYLNNTKNKMISTNLAIKYARFTLKILKNTDGALEILNSALAKDPNNPRLYLQLIDVTMHKVDFTSEEVEKWIDQFLEKDSTDSEQKVLFAQRKLEFLEDFGADVTSVQTAYEEYQKYIKINRENNKKKDSKSDIAKKDKSAPSTASTTNSYNNYSNYGNSAGGSSYQYGGNNPGQQGAYGGQYQQYGQGSDQYQYGGWQYQGNYGGYNQWGGYGSGYSY